MFKPNKANWELKVLFRLPSWNGIMLLSDAELKLYHGLAILVSPSVVVELWQPRRQSPAETGTVLMDAQEVK